MMRATHQVVTARDRAILRDLWLYRYLDSAQVTRLHFTNPQTARRRLRKLHERGLVERFRPTSLVQAGFGQWCYHLTSIAARLVAEEEGLAISELGRPPRGLQGERYVAHHGLVTDFRIWLREGCSASAGTFGYQFIPGYEEVRGGPKRARRITLSLAGGRSVIPDGAFVLFRSDGRSALFALEVDRGTEPLTGKHRNSITRKLEHYNEAFEGRAERRYSELFGRPFTGFRILCLVPGEARQDAFLRIAENVGLCPLVWVAPIELVRSRGRLEQPSWRDRLDGDPLSLTL